MSRSLLSFAAALLALASVEGLFRLVHDGLPSLEALNSPEAKAYWGHEAPSIATSPSTSQHCQDVPGDTRGGSPHVAPPVRVHTLDGRQEPALSLLVAGDSIAWGYGIDPNNAWGAVLGRSLYTRLDRNTRIDVVGIPGGGYCEVLRGVHRELDASAPDLVVLQVFADDLEKRAMMILDGTPVAFPDQVQSVPLRSLVSHSYTANWIWAQWGARTSSGPMRFVNPEGQVEFRDSIANLRTRLEEMGAGLAVFLLPPVGMEACRTQGAPSICRWYLEDLDLMGRLLEEAGVLPMRLDTLWAGPDDLVLREERERAHTEADYIPIHPNSAGHKKLAEALVQQVEPMLLGRP